jgi:hypothetical protein
MALEIFNEIEQGSEAWGALRAGVITASEMHSVIAKGEGKMRRSYMLRLCGERLTGVPAETFENGHTQRGRDMEAEARTMFCFVHDVEMRQVGFIRNGYLGVSPDGLIGDDGMFEAKSKLPHLQIELILKDDFPPSHKAQCQGAMWIAERDYVDFCSFWPNLPLFTKRARRDEDYIDMLRSECARFEDELCAMVEKVRRYGSEPSSLTAQLQASLEGMR